MCIKRYTIWYSSRDGSNILYIINKTRFRLIIDRISRSDEFDKIINYKENNNNKNLL